MYEKKRHFINKFNKFILNFYTYKLSSILKILLLETNLLDFKLMSGIS